MSRGRRGALSRRGGAQPLQDVLPPAGRPRSRLCGTGIPSARHTGSAPHSGHGSAIRHTRNLPCFQDSPFSLPWQHKFGHDVSDTILWQVATIGFLITSWLLCLRIALGLPGPDTACHFTQHYVRKGSLLLFCTWRPLSETGQCEVCSLMLNFKYLCIYTVMYFPIMTICELNFHNLFNDLQHRNTIIHRTFCK